MKTRIGRRGLFLAVAFGATALTAACMTGNPQQQQDQVAGGTGRQCFLPSDVNGFNPVDDTKVRVTVGVKTVYELEVGCANIDWAQRIGIRSLSGSSRVCEGVDAELFASGGPFGRQRCLVTNIRRLTPEELKAPPATPKA